MKVKKLMRKGIFGIKPQKVKTLDGRSEYFCYLHGEQGRGRWQVRFPLEIRDFPCNTNIEEDQEYRLIDLKKKDKRDNDLYLLGKGKDDGKYLIFWELAPGFRGSASYSVSGNASVISCGEEAQGMAGRMGGAYCPVILVKGDCVLKWHRTGRLYGSAADWIATYSENKWKVCAETDCNFENCNIRILKEVFKNRGLSYKFYKEWKELKKELEKTKNLTKEERVLRNKIKKEIMKVFFKYHNLIK